MRRLFFLFFFTIFTAVGAFSQGANPFWDRVRYGGNFGLAFGSNSTYIEASPTISYLLTERFSAGVGFTYQYVSREYEFISQQGGVETKTLKASVFGPKIQARYNVTEQFFALAELEQLSNEYYKSFDEKVRVWSTGTFLGGGYSQPLGGRGNVYIAALWNFTFDDKKSPYPEPYVLRVGFNL
ncbi:hypothetical protein FUAX_33500 [Fulvitalea axinellae]|uniref:Outer membrane protein beta-barrel domain-containing protein n=1 Tax=Fulvitalea axinellae TaxID=1182444 RepID=A0AAU9CL41_9BACT|nr:hypothetical protein FUAX_33500 [Fulvitalea axinellae]